MDVLAPAHFICEPYSGIVDAFTEDCLDGRRVWPYRVPMICVHIVKTHLPDRVARQFGMVQNILGDPGYSQELQTMTLKG